MLQNSFLKSICSFSVLIIKYHSLERDLFTQEGETLEMDVKKVFISVVSAIRVQLSV